MEKWRKILSWTLIIKIFFAYVVWFSTQLKIRMDTVREILFNSTQCTEEKLFYVKAQLFFALRPVPFSKQYN